MPAATNHRELEVSWLDVVPDGFLSAEVEDAQFYRATQKSLPGFEFGYLRVFAASQTLAIVPYFTTVFSLGTMLSDGPIKQAIGGIGLRIACVGHPCAAFGKVDGKLDAGTIETVTKALLKKASIVCFKGFDADLPAAGFVRVSGLPVAIVDFNVERWRDLRSSRNLRRKLKEGAKIRYEEHVGLPTQYLDSIYELYSATHARAKTTFGKLTKDFFLMSSPISVYILLFSEERLIGFAQIMRKADSAVASFMGMDYSVNEQVGLYFLIVMRIMDAAEGLGLKTIELGETSYTFKKRIGASLAPTWIYYRHQNWIANWVLGKLAPLLEPSADELV